MLKYTITVECPNCYYHRKITGGDNFNIPLQCCCKRCGHVWKLRAQVFKPRFMEGKLYERLYKSQQTYTLDRRTVLDELGSKYWYVTS